MRIRTDYGIAEIFQGIDGKRHLQVTQGDKRIIVNSYSTDEEARSALVSQARLMGFKGDKPDCLTPWEQDVIAQAAKLARRARPETYKQAAE